MRFFAILPCINFLPALNSNVNEILSKRILTSIKGMDDFRALFCYLPLVKVVVKVKFQTKQT